MAKALHLCRSKADAEDLVQETCARFITVFGQLASLPGEASLGSWLTTTLSNCFNDQLRRNYAREHTAADPLVKEGISMGQPSSPRPDYDRITDEQFATAMESLSPTLRSTLELHLRGRRYREIAKALGISMGNVGKRLHDARDRLKTFLEQFMPNGEN